MERQLEGAQAAVHGGHCYKNIKKAHEHLARTEDPELPTYRLRHCHWACEMLFGPACATLLLICKERQRRAHHSIRRSPACSLIDQAKAFEMLCHLWLQSLLTKLKLPTWAVNAFMQAVRGRRLRDQLRPQWTSPVLLRGQAWGVSSAS